MTEETNKRIGDYEILNELGSGGMGRVYRVRNVISDRIEAMKILLPDLAGRQELADRFSREIKLLASLNHPNIASLRTALTLDNQLVMIMEYVEGTSLAERLERGPIAVPDALNYIDQVLNALSYAHQHNVIHRDIKPANMMLTPQGVVKLMDFGIARSGEDSSLTMTGTTLGSINYMSPEQVKGQTADARSDVYSVGVSLYEMVTGQRPFQADSDFSIMTAHVKEAPKPPVELEPGLPPALNEIILMAIAKEPAQRFQSADAFRNALSSVHPVSPVAPPVTQSTRGATMVDTAVTAAFLPGTPVPPMPPRNQSSAPVRTMVDAKVTPIPNAAPAPSAVQPTAPPPPPSSSHRGLYITLGALIVLAVLVAAGIYWPGRGKAAEESAKTAITAMTKTAPNPVTQTKPAAAVLPPQTSAGMPTTPAPAPVQSASLHPQALTTKNPKQVAVAQGADQTATKTDPKELDEVEHSVDQLSSRAGEVNSSLDRLQQQQAAAGYGLRGDMAAHQESMKLNLSKAQAAVEHGDTARAKRYSDLAQVDIEALEHFLGR
jgi:serine/threonine protein kinase